VRDHDGRKNIDRDEDPSIFYDGPLIVLTSRFSASASEILAGALQDYDRAAIVGDSSTHGKGTVQSLIQLNRHIPATVSSTPGALKITIRKFYRATGSSTQTLGVTPDIVLPSVNEFAEVGEGSLDNPLPWDKVDPAKFEKMNRVQPILEELRKRSKQRVASDKDYDYVRDDIEQFKKALADKTVSLNEGLRLKEKKEIESKSKSRQEELKARPELNEKVYELTLKLADQAGLPAAVSKTNRVANVTTEAHAIADGDEPAATDSLVAAIDAPLKEAKYILADMIALLAKDPSLVATVSPKKQNSEKAGSNLTTKQDAESVKP
jgi:carboxyl-terminal processing protease